MGPKERDLGAALRRAALPLGPAALHTLQRITVPDRDEMDVERILIYHLAESPSDRVGSGTSACGGGEGGYGRNPSRSGAAGDCGWVEGASAGRPS